jgi:hypothetical protein
VKALADLLGLGDTKEKIEEGFDLGRRAVEALERIAAALEAARYTP